MSRDYRDVAFFPGFFDSDGRPWENVIGGEGNYQKALESALKIALLTQRKIVIPSGYLLDNPILQRVFLNYGSDNAEARCFKELASDLIQITLSDSLASKTINNWNEVLHHWIAGTGSKRGQVVYLNCLKRHDAESLQQDFKNADQFTHGMQQAVQAMWGHSLPDVLSVYDEIGFSVKEHKFLAFDDLLRERLLSGDEQYSEYRDHPKDKLLAIAEVVEKEDSCRISRSLLNNRKLCLELGVKDHDILSYKEYKLIAPILAHYHHFAFAESSGTTSFATFLNPTPDAIACERLSSRLEELSSHRLDGMTPPFSLSWPLSKISFKKLRDLRMGENANRFLASLDSVHEATRTGSVSEYKSALLAHARYIAGQLSFDFRATNPKDLAEGVAKCTDPTGATQLAKFSFTLFREFVPNINRELQVRWFFRTLRSELGDDE